LLREDGVIFISIDENEAHNLRKLCEEVFGEENYAGDIVWKNSSKNDQSYVSIQHEYILCFVKNKQANNGLWQEKKEGLEDIYQAFDKFKNEHGEDWKAIHKKALSWYKEFPESNPIYSHKHYSWMDKKGVYFPADISGPNFGQYRYDVIHPVTKKVCKEPASGWRFPEETMKQRIADNLVHFGDDENTIPNNKTYLKDTEFQSLTSIKYRDGRVASKKLISLLGGNYFTNPKDHEVLMQLFKAINLNNDDLVLDYFSGSGTVGQALSELNNEDNYNRKFILVQIPESIIETSDAYIAGYKKISNITIERNKRVIEKIIEENKSKSLDLFKAENEELSGLGFKVFKLVKSNFPRVEFAPDIEKTDEENIELFKKYVAEKEAQLITMFNRDDLITEILLKNGFNLNYKVEKQGQFTKNDIYLATDGEKETFICLDNSLETETVNYFKTHINTKFICLERALDTTKKYNLKLAMGNLFHAF